jgi:hypothetical protein
MVEQATPVEDILEDYYGNGPLDASNFVSEFVISGVLCSIF